MHLAPDPELLHAAGTLAGLKLDVEKVAAVSGGDISGAFRCEDSRGRSWFMKINKASFIDAFEAEEAGLLELSKAKALRVPHVVANGVTTGRSWLLLEWLEMLPVDALVERRLGGGLAEMHRISAGAYGWDRNNFIGVTPQLNQPKSNWTGFYCERRLLPQVRLAEENGAPQDFVHKVRQFIYKIPEVMDGYAPEPSLLHGDLWSGNCSRLDDGAPVIFDPAVYYGDRETDLAMTLLFGGFSPSFYQAYAAEWPLEPGHEWRTTLYQFYHVLNHFNLFGGAYLSQADRMIDQLMHNSP